MVKKVLLALSVAAVAAVAPDAGMLWHPTA
jgi:hypothetical protein